MQDQVFIRDPHLRRLVHDFDALADLLHSVTERERQKDPHRQAAPGHEQEFTTEWQMEPEAEAVHPG